MSAAKPAPSPAAERRPPPRAAKPDPEDDASDDEIPASPLQRVANALSALFGRIKAAFLAKLVLALDMSLALLRKLRNLASGPEERDERDRGHSGHGARAPVGRRGTAPEPAAEEEAPKPRRLRRMLLYALLMSAGAAAGFYITGHLLVQEAEMRPAELDGLRSDVAESKKSAVENESEAERQKADSANYLKRLEEGEAELEKSKAEQAAQAELLEQKDAEIERRKAENAEQAKLLANSLRQLAEEQSRRVNAEFRLRSAYPGRGANAPRDDIARARAEPAGSNKLSAAPASGNCAVGSGNVGATLKGCLNTFQR